MEGAREPVEHCIATDMLEVVDQPMQRKDDVLVT